jgi:hypothetical protein
MENDKISSDFLFYSILISNTGNSSTSGMGKTGLA